MTKIKLLFTALLLTSLYPAQTCSTDNIVIKQGDKVFDIVNPEQTVTLNRSDFSIEFLNKPYQEKKKQHYAVQAVVTEGQIEADQQEGTVIKAVNFFAPGTGFSTESDQVAYYPFLSYEGHNYLYYTSTKDRRLDKVGTSGTWDIYKWTLKGVYENEQDITWKNYQKSEVFIALVIDRNLDGIMQKGEFFNVKINFKD